MTAALAKGDTCTWSRAWTEHEGEFRSLRALYGIEASPDLISTVTDAVLEEVVAWQQRAPDPAYPLVFFDAIRVKICDKGMVRSKAIHIVLGVRADGGKELLGLWVEQNEGAKFWLRVMNELRNRGGEDVMLAVRTYPTRSPPCSPKPQSSPASTICSATRWTSYRERTQAARSGPEGHLPGCRCPGRRGGPAGGDPSGLGEAPERNQQLAHHRDDCDPARPAL